MDREIHQGLDSYNFHQPNKLRQLLESFHGQNIFAKLSILFLALVALTIPVFIAGRQIFNSHASNGQQACIQPPSCVQNGSCSNIANVPGVTWCNSNNNQILVDVGDEEYVTGPIDYADVSFFTMPFSGGIRGYDANSNTFSFLGQSLQAFDWQIPHPTAEHISLTPGITGEFDDCGAWLLSTYKITDSHWIGWYHAEFPCRQSPTGGYPIVEGQTHWSVAFAESFDSGKTWQKTNYPNNQVLTADSQYSGNPTLDRFSGAKVIVQGNYFYMISVGTNYHYFIARSHLADLGKPGTWFKYYCASEGLCDFNQPGIGGHMTPITNVGDSLTYNSYLHQFLTVSVSGKYGFFFYTAPDNNILQWGNLNAIGKAIYPKVSTGNDMRVDNWSDHNSTSKQVYAYPSFIAPDGNSFEVGKEFYLYYMKMFDGDGFDKRYIMRRKITLTIGNSQYPFKAALTRYERTNPSKILVSTELAKPSEGYVKIQNLGRLLTYPADGFKPLYLCYIPSWQDYMPTDLDPSKYNWKHCENPNGDIFVRTLGYVATKQTADATIAIYRCYNKTKLNHFISTDPACEGEQTNWKLGYIFPVTDTTSPSPTNQQFPTLQPSGFQTVPLIPSPISTPTAPSATSQLTPLPTGRFNPGNAPGVQ